MSQPAASSSPPSSSRSSPSSFPRFLDLPPSLRFHIWHLAADQAGGPGPLVLPLTLVHEQRGRPRRAHLHIERRWRGLYLRGRLRARLALLHACRESRAELLAASHGPAWPWPAYSLQRAPQLGVCEVGAAATWWRAAAAVWASAASTAGTGEAVVVVHDDEDDEDSHHHYSPGGGTFFAYMYPPFAHDGFAIDWRHDLVIFNFLEGFATWQWHPHGLPEATSRAAHVIVVHDHGGSGGGAPAWMHRVVTHFGSGLRGLWFMSPRVWREAQRALLRIPWGPPHGAVAGVIGHSSSSRSNDNNGEELVERDNAWDVLVREDREVSRDLVARGEVSMNDLPAQLGLTLQAVNGWSTPVRVGTIIAVI